MRNTVLLEVLINPERWHEVGTSCQRFVFKLDYVLKNNILLSMNLPPYVIFPEITAEHVLLRQIIPADIKDIVEISRYDGKPALTEAEAMEMQNRINADYQNGASIHWGIADKETNTIVGTCGYYRGLDEGTGEIGCILRSAFRGKGYMTAAIELAIHFGLHTIGLKRIIAITTTYNDKALQLLARLNFKKIADLGEDKVEYQFTDHHSWNSPQP